MRLGVVTTGYPRHAGDPAGCFVAGLARWLHANGHEIEVIAAGPGAATDGPIPVRRVHAAAAGLFYGAEGAPERLERSLAAWARAPVFSAALAVEVTRRARRWDAVLSHWLVPSALAVAVAAGGRRLAGDRRPLPHAAVAHSGDVHQLARAPAGVADAAIAGLLAAAPRTRVCFAGDHLRDRLLGALRAPALRRALEVRSIVSPVGLDAAALARIREAIDPVAARAALGIEAAPGGGARAAGHPLGDLPGRPLVAFLGRLVPIKGVAVLLEAAARLAEPVVVAIAGDGPEREALAARAARLGLDARFLGELGGPRRDLLLAAADVLVVPSIDLPGGRTEGTPAVVLEAMAAGVPLVAARTGGIPAVAGGRAALFPPGDVEACARALAATLAAPAVARARARAAGEAARAWDWSAVGPALLALLEDPAAPSPRAAVDRAYPPAS